MNKHLNNWLDEVEGKEPETSNKNIQKEIDFRDSLLDKVQNKDEKGANEWVKRAEQGEIMRIM